jgi:hypothetical protein
VYILSSSLADENFGKVEATMTLLLLFLTCALLGPAASQMDTSGDSVAEASVSVGLYLSTMAGKELGVTQLQKFFRFQRNGGAVSHGNGFRQSYDFELQRQRCKNLQRNK